MTDIVERLRDNFRSKSPMWTIQGEAADEIERLRRGLDEERAEAEQWQVRCAGCLTAAEGHTSDPANDGDYGWTLAYQRTLELRQAYDALLRERDGMGTIAPCYRL